MVRLVHVSARGRLVVCLTMAAALAPWTTGAGLAPASAAARVDGQPWTNASLAPDRRAGLLLAQMTLTEKAELMSNDPGTGYAYYNAPIDRLGIPALKMFDAGAGLRLGSITVPGTGSTATAMPSPLLLGSSFDTAIAARYGKTVAQEARQAGGNILLGPNGDLVRNPWWGRANETESEDPFLTGQIVASYVAAAQSQGIIADLKHYDVYNQEVNRGFGQNSQVSERAIQEVYTRPWAAAVAAGLGSTMCSFNKINGTYSCQNGHTLNDVLKRQLGFKGFVLTDFGALHDTVEALNGGTDMETGQRQFYTPDTITAAVESGQVSLGTVNDHVLRILRTMFAFGLFDRAATQTHIAVQSHGEVARDVADAGIVMLKNDNDALPLTSRANSIAVIGGDADHAVSQGGASHVSPTYQVSLLDGVRERASSGVDVEYAPGTDPVGGTSMLPGPAAVPSSVLSDGSGSPGLQTDYFAGNDLSGDPIVSRTEPGVRWDQGFVGGSPAFSSLYGSALTPTPGNAQSGRYTGTFTAPADGPYTFSLSGYGDGQLFIDGELAVDMTGQDGLRTVTSATRNLGAGDTLDLTIEYKATRPLTGLDPGSLQLGWTHPSNALSPAIQAAVDLARRSDVAIVQVANYSSEQRDQGSLTLPNDQDQLVRAVSAVNPNTIVVIAAGNPILMPWLRQVPAVLDEFFGGQEQGHAVADILFGDVNPSGKLPMTFPRDEEQPTEIGVQNPWNTSGDLDVPYLDDIFTGYRGYDRQDVDPLFPFGYGLSYTTFDYSGLSLRAASGGTVDASFVVTNMGNRTGREVAQVYTGALPTSVPTPEKQLAGFTKVRLAPGQSRRVTVSLGRRSTSYYDEATRAWVTPAGAVPVLVGGSSDDLPLSGSVNLRAASTSTAGS